MKHRQESHEPIVRGRKLVLKYEHGSYCPEPDSRKRSLQSRDPARGGADDDEDDDDDDDTGRGRGSKSKTGERRRKSTVISLLCERNPKDGDPPVTVSFVSAVDDCFYVFEARTTAACPTADAPSGGLGPGGVFGVMCVFLPIPHRLVSSNKRPVPW